MRVLYIAAINTDLNAVHNAERISYDIASPGASIQLLLLYNPAMGGSCKKNSLLA